MGEKRKIVKSIYFPSGEGAERGCWHKTFFLDRNPLRILKLSIVIIIVDIGMIF